MRMLSSIQEVYYWNSIPSLPGGLFDKNSADYKWHQRSAEALILGLFLRKVASEFDARVAITKEQIQGELKDLFTYDIERALALLVTYGYIKLAKLPKEIVQ